MAYEEEDVVPRCSLRAGFLVNSCSSGQTCPKECGPNMWVEIKALNGSSQHITPRIKYLFSGVPYFDRDA